ncbi:MAG: DJ-1/PfpI family protein [Clostridium sp.]|nr:DJ-1/PfpI family protein [Clostridium sp.]
MVYILLADGFEEAEALVPADLLRRAGIETVLVGVTGAAVSGGQGITVQTDLALDQVDLDKAQLIFLPGGSVGVQNLGACAEVEQLVAQAVQKDLWVAAICAAPTLLARWGYLNGRKAICYPTLTGKLTGAVLSTDNVAVDGRFITGEAAGAAFDFGLALVKALAGAEKSEQIKNSVCYR